MPGFFYAFPYWFRDVTHIVLLLTWLFFNQWLYVHFGCIFPSLFPLLTVYSHPPVPLSTHQISHAPAQFVIFRKFLDLLWWKIVDQPSEQTCFWPSYLISVYISALFWAVLQHNLAQFFPFKLFPAHSHVNKDRKEPAVMTFWATP